MCPHVYHHTHKAFFSVCRIMCVLLWHIESIPKLCSLQCSGGLGATHLSSWCSLLGIAVAILIGSRFRTPVGGHASLVRSRFKGGLKWRIKNLIRVRVHFIDETKVYFCCCATLPWVMDMERWMFKKLHIITNVHTHVRSDIEYVYIPTCAMYVSTHMHVCVCGLGVSLFMPF